MPCAGRQLVALAVLLWAGPGSAGVSGAVEGDFSRTRLETTDAAGAKSHLDTDVLTQRYRLSVDQQLWPTLRLSLGGRLEDSELTAAGRAGSPAVHLRSTQLDGGVEVGNPFLGGAVAYSRRERDVAGLSTSIVNDEPSLRLGWRPVDLPTVSFRLARPEVHDTARTLVDQATTTASLTLDYAPVQALTLRYAVGSEALDDRLHGLETTAILQSGAVTYGTTFGAWRTSVALALSVSARQALTTNPGAGGTVATQVRPDAVLSLVEAFPAVPTRDSLTPNVVLGDGNEVAPSAINLGYSATLAGDVANRDLGVQLPFQTMPVNTLYVWMDRPIPPEIAATLGWAAYTSDDNQTWTPLPLDGPIGLPLIQSRFEVTFARTTARFVKVVVRPLGIVTTDPQLANLFVTEVQPYLVAPAPLVARRDSSNAEMVTMGIRTQLGGRDDLAYDLSASASRAEQDRDAQYAWAVVNGLSYGRKLGQLVTLSARGSRQDTLDRRSRQSSHQLSVSLAVDELPSLGHSLTVTGQRSDRGGSSQTTGTVLLFNRLVPYRGLALLAGGTYAVTLSEPGSTSRYATLTVNASAQPHRVLTLTGAYGLSRTESGVESVVVARHAEGTLSFSPIPALYVAGGVTHDVTGARAYTLGSLSLGVSPFQGGDLRLSFSYNETLDSRGAVTRLMVPGLRWTISRTAVLSVTYSMSDSGSDSEAVRARTLGANLRIMI